MKRIPWIRLGLMMFSLFSVSYLVKPVSADTTTRPLVSPDPKVIMDSESVDLNKQTLQHHKRIAELENLLTEANTKISELDGK